MMLLNAATCACCLSLTVMVLELAPAYLSSAVHVIVPVFYRCVWTGTVQVYFQPKVEGKARLHAASILLITAY